MLGRLKNALSGKPRAPRARVAARPTVETRLAPDQPFCAIGDIHGRLDLLKPLHAKLRAEFGADIPVIFIGDIVDRGPDSAGTLRYIHDLCRDQPEANICIMGNHEQMMLDFIDDPAGRGLRWLSFGGAETLQSFGLTPPRSSPDLEDAVELAEALEEAMPAGILTWLRTLPPLWSSGNIHCVHAAMDPESPVTEQSSRVMINGHPAFLEVPRLDDQTVLHGHTIMAEATVGDTRISIDTGAYSTGRLTAAHVAPDSCRFIT
ncbi:metallophosphoesterase [Pseudooceanicola sp.]|uniref:metallophosphoesterase n=1 Tax=Pseudooceanicola sp. TaxID=1914328 RepID=UPI0035C6DE80